MRERSPATSSGPVRLRLALAGGQAAEMAARLEREGIVIVGDTEAAELVAGFPEGAASLGGRASPGAPASRGAEALAGARAALPRAGRPSPHAASAGRDDPGLSPRELEILEYLADGWSNAEIASVLGIGLRTVRFHLEGLYAKLGSSRRGEAVREGLRLGLVSFEA